MRPAFSAPLVGSKIDEATIGLSGTSLRAAIRSSALIAAGHGKMVKLQEAERQGVIEHKAQAKRPHDSELLISAGMDVA